jgi:ABC-type transporter Mla subunit MlaD
MSTPANHWKLGLFVVLGVGILMGVLVFVGARGFQAQTIRYTTYYDESVQGLDIGSPVKFRGVTIGNVSGIGIAADNRHVEVAFEVAVKDLTALGLSAGKGTRAKMKVPDDLRIQLASAGITGVKFLLIDYFKPESSPRPALPFLAPENYIPAAPSVMKNLEDSVVNAVDRFPELAEQLGVVMSRLGDVLTEVENEKLPQRMRSTMTQVDALVANAQTTLALVNPLLERAGGEKGLVSSLQRTSDSVGLAAQNASRLTPALEDTLRDIQGAATSIQQLADALHRDPDMLLKGRGKREPR